MLARDGDAEQPARCGLPYQRHGKRVRLIDLGGLGLDALARERLDLRAERVLGWRHVEVHDHKNTPWT